jgi:hypothetical protein
VQHRKLYGGVWHNHEQSWNIATPKALQQATVLDKKQKMVYNLHKINFENI